VNRIQYMAMLKHLEQPKERNIELDHQHFLDAVKHTKIEEIATDFEWIYTKHPPKLSIEK